MCDQIYISVERDIARIVGNANSALFRHWNTFSKLLVNEVAQLNVIVTRDLPTTRSSPSVAAGLIRVQMSIVKMVLELLNTEVRELINAAIIAANIKPFNPTISIPQ